MHTTIILCTFFSSWVEVNMQSARQVSRNSFWQLRMSSMWTAWWRGVAQGVGLRKGCRGCGGLEVEGLGRVQGCGRGVKDEERVEDVYQRQRVRIKSGGGGIWCKYVSQMEGIGMQKFVGLGQCIIVMLLILSLINVMYIIQCLECLLK